MHKKSKLDKELEQFEVPLAKIKKPFITRISSKDLAKKHLFFLEHKIPFRKESTNGRTIIHAGKGWGSWMNKESVFKPSELYFIKSVKEYIIKNGTYKKVKNKFTDKEGNSNTEQLKKIKYFYYNKKLKPGDEFKHIKEIDLKNAYWSLTHFKLGLIDEHLYQKGLTVSKKSRLAAIGTLAKVTKILEYDGKTETNLDPKLSKETAFLWHTISYQVGRIMARASRVAGNSFLFFWVDAIFVLPGVEKEIIKLFKKQGFQCSVSNCEWIRFEDSKIVVKSTEKAKWVTKIVETKVTIDSKHFIKRHKTKEYRDERPFPYKKALTEADIMNLSTQ